MVHNSSPFSGFHLSPMPVSLSFFFLFLPSGFHFLSLLLPLPFPNKLVCLSFYYLFQNMVPFLHSSDYHPSPSVLFSHFMSGVSHFLSHLNLYCSSISWCLSFSYLFQDSSSFLPLSINCCSFFLATCLSFITQYFPFSHPSPSSTSVSL